MSIVRRIPWTEQPQYAVDVDWSHPLARNLHVFSYGGVIQTRSYRAANTVLGVCREGLVSLGFAPHYIKELDTDQVVTFLSKTYLQSNPGGRFAGYLGQDYYATAADNRQQVLQEWTSASQVSPTFRINTGSVSGQYFESYPLIGAGFRLESSFASSYLRVWKNGTQVANVSLAAGTYAADTRLRVLFYGSLWGMGFLGAVSAVDEAALRENPWQILVPREQRIYAAAGNAFKPAWARNRNSIISGVAR